MTKKWEELTEDYSEKILGDDYKKEFIPGAGSFTDEHGHSSLHGNTLVHKWNSKGRGFLTLFSVFWNTFVFFFISATWNGSVTVNGTHHNSLQTAYESDPSVLIFLIFPIVGIFMGYITLTLWLNKTVIKYSYKGIEVTSGPLPWPRGKKTIAHNDLLQCFVQVYSSHTQNKVPVYAYRVVASQLNGPTMVIEDGLDNYRDARILEQWLESKLSIKDSAVHGEVAS